MSLMRKFSGFTILEVLGATSIILTLATISLLSVRDNLAASQRAAMQRELQILNTARVNYYGAGGEIAEDASVTEAIDAMKAGMNLSEAGENSTNYIPLTSDPILAMDVAGLTYNLGYDPQDGFFYAADDGVSALGFAGEELVDTYEGLDFDPMNSDQLAEALAIFPSLSPGTQQYDDYLAALNAGLAADIFSEADLLAVNNVLGDAGLANVNGQWVEPSFDITDPTAVLGALSQIDDVDWSGVKWYQSGAYSEQLGSLLAAYRYALENPDPDYPDLANQLNTQLTTEFLRNLGTGPSPGSISSIAGKYVPYEWAVGFAESRTNLESDWSRLNFTGVNLISRMLSGIPSLTGAQLSQAASLDGSVLSGMNLFGFDPTGKSLYAVNLTDVRNLDIAKLNAATNFIGTQFNNLNLAGFNVQGKNFRGNTTREYGASFANVTGITGAQLQTAASLPQNLSGFNMAGYNFANAQIQNPWGFGDRDFSNMKGVTGADLNAFSRADAYSKVNLSGINLAGLNFSGRTFRDSDLSNTGVTVAQLNAASGNVSYFNITNAVTGAGTYVSRNGGLSGANLSGLDLTGLNMSNKVLGGNLAGATGVTASMLNSTLQWPGGAAGTVTVLNPDSAFTARNSTSGALTTQSYANRGMANGNYWPSNLDWENVTTANRAAYGTDFSTSGLSGSQISNAGQFVNGPAGLTYRDFRSANLAGKNLAGFSAANKDLSSANFSGVTGITGATLNSATYLGVNSMLAHPQVTTVNVSRMDMTGFDASIPEPIYSGSPATIVGYTTGRNLYNWSFKDAVNLDISMIQGAVKGDLGIADFRGTGISASQLLNAGWTQQQIQNVRF